MGNQIVLGYGILFFVSWRMVKLDRIYFAMEEIINKLIQFRNERDWEQFHNAKDLSIALNIECSELLELFLWKNAEDADPEKVKEELADVFAYAFLIAEKFNFDVKEIVLDKIKENGKKYPVEKAKGSAKKYNEF